MRGYEDHVFEQYHDGDELTVRQLIEVLQKVPENRQDCTVMTYGDNGDRGGWYYVNYVHEEADDDEWFVTVTRKEQK